MSTQNVNVARFARNVEWDFWAIFKHGVDTPQINSSDYLIKASVSRLLPTKLLLLRSKQILFFIRRHGHFLHVLLQKFFGFGWNTNSSSGAKYAQDFVELYLSNFWALQIYSTCFIRIFFCRKIHWTKKGGIFKTVNCKQNRSKMTQAQFSTFKRIFYNNNSF